MRTALMILLTAAFGCGGARPGSRVDSGSMDQSSSDLAAPPDLADSGGSGEMTYSLAAGDCFTFATSTSSQSGGRACGDLLALSGGNVDLSNGAGSSQLCLLSGTYTSLTAVPASYASCAWTTYIEGLGGLADAGLIVLDSTGSHHYRLHVVSETLPDLIFSFASID
jgi:hypothetical protein